MKDSPLIYEMGLHELGDFTRSPFESIWALRVPGGWIYTHCSGNGSMTSTFVPFHNEFQVVPDEPWGKNPNR